MQEKRSVAFHTLGCKLNYSESSAMSAMFQKQGFEKVDFEQAADVYVINTCSVTENADRECRYLVRRVRRRAPDGVVVITGCYAQLKPAEIASIPGVDLVLGAAEKFNIVEHLREFSRGMPVRVFSCDIADVNGFQASYSGEGRTRSFLKVQDGCDYTCSFCTIPMARGKSRSDTIENVLKNVRTLAAEGIKEIVLTGVNLGDFGKRPENITVGGPQDNFFSLVRALDTEEGIERFRISSIEPNLLTREIIEFVAKSRRFMPHFHIPLQSGSNRILGMMRRRYRKELYSEKVNMIRSLMPHCCIGADVIVGFPGETEEDFQDTHDFLQGLDVSYLHVFTYSERDNTPAIDIRPAVPGSVRNERNRKLRNLSFMKTRFFRSQHEGTKRKVLFESGGPDGMMEGYTDNYIKVTTPYRREWQNTIVEWDL